MSGIVYGPVQSYLMNLLPKRDDVLRAMEEQASRRDIPIVGPAVGRYFFQLAMISGAKSVFEMGSAIGYSTIWWARGVGDGGKVVYTDGDRRNADEARGYFKQAGVENRIEIQTGDALELLSERKPESLDIIFNDVDKHDYPRVLRLAVPRLKKGGLLVTDNALWSGRVTEPAAAQDENTRAIAEYNRVAYGSPALFTTILPLRDGIAVSVKL